MSETIYTDVAGMDEITPYEEAFDFIRKYQGASSATGMAKLLLSLYNSRHPFSVSECAWNFDRERCALAVRVVAYYLEYGEDEELRLLGREIVNGFPDLLELSNAANDAKSAVRKKWQAEIEVGFEDTDD